ncbi:non-homologous end-joining DNA ligase [Pseudonocardia nantongensis]|uniref:non-homologous end-joining DNA ligase n=1 Tax=Pseudonocardia nantongensis TaxID=1181885 RepID=UPI00397C389D
MLATLCHEPFSGGDWVFERKLDGERLVVVRDEAGARLYTRNRKNVSDTYPELVAALDEQAAPGLVADGEVVAFDGAQTSFSRLQGRLGITDPGRARSTGIAVTLYLFDAPVVAGHDVTAVALRTRKRLLVRSVEAGDGVRLSRHRNTDGERYLREACERGWEGVIAKRVDAPYRPGTRSDSWLKLKCVQAQELVIGGWTEPQGSRTGFGALLVGYHDGSGLRYAGKVGTGFDHRALGGLRERFGEVETGTSPFRDRVPESGVHWLRPELVAQIGFSEWTRDGRLRHPRYLGLREDKDPADVVREEVR